MKKNLFLFIIIFIVVVMIIVSSFFIWQYQNDENDKYSSWQTFVSTPYSFEIKYPNHLKAWEYKPAKATEAYSVSFENVSASTEISGRKIVLNISIYFNQGELENAFNENSDPYRIRTSEGNVVINGYSAEKIRFSPKKSDDIGSLVYLIYDKNTALMVFPSDYSGIDENELNHIISTFKFIKQ